MKVIQGLLGSNNPQITPVPSAGATQVKYASLLIGMNFTGQAGQAQVSQIFGVFELVVERTRFDFY